MQPVEQRQMTDLENGVAGDCWRACLASVLELDLDDVPHFVQDEIDGKVESNWNASIEWLRLRGLTLAWFGLWGDERPCLLWGGERIEYWFHAPGHWIATVVSPRVVELDGTPALHAVVMSGDRIVWDPHPGRDEGHRGFVQANLLVHV